METQGSDASGEMKRGWLQRTIGNEGWSHDGWLHDRKPPPCHGVDERYPPREIEWRYVTPSIAPCHCTTAARVVEAGDGRFYVACENTGCWAGPSRATRDAAIDSWNHLMGRYQIERIGR